MPGCFREWLYLGFSAYQMVDSWFSDEEMLLMANGDIMPTKRQIMSKMADRFAKIEAKFKWQIDGIDLPSGTLLKAGKISRGENYKGQPYMVLDYPRLFTGNDVLNVRLLFWWGHYFTMSLHLAGKYWEHQKPKFANPLNLPLRQSVRFQVSGSVWENDINATDFHYISDMDNSFHQSQIMRSSFIKIVDYLPLDDTPDLESFSFDVFENFVSILKSR